MADKRRVLVVDDDDQIRNLMGRLLGAMGYEVSYAQDGVEAIANVHAAPPDIILLDAVMPRMGGVEVTRAIKGSEEGRIIPIIMVTGLRDVEDKVRALEAGADDFLSKPFDKVELQARIASLLKVKESNEQALRYRRELEAEVEKRTRQLQEALTRLGTASLETIYRLSRAAEFRDEDTGVHLHRMSRYSAAIARKMGLADRTVESILYATPMHDVGKIGIPDQILLKPGKLEPREFEVMKMHTIIGSQILHGSSESFLKLGEVICLTHHERWDGTGYPHGISGPRIPLAGCIAAVSDVFDALTTRRPYKNAMAADRAMEIISTGRGAHFNPDVTDAFLSIEEEIFAIKETSTDEGEGSKLYHLVQMAEQRGVAG